MAPPETIAALVDDVCPNLAVNWKRGGVLNTTRTHPTGRPVSDGTYTRHACRCPGCQRAHLAAKRINMEDAEVQQAYARTGSVSAAMQATGLPYRRVRDVIRAMAA
jgi:hypothetical protein